MLLGIDHVVIAVNDPDRAAARLTGLVGLEASPGGRHAGLGTFNRLVWLGDSYLELIGVDDRGLADRWSIGAAARDRLDAGSEGVVTFAVASDDLRRDVARLRAAGGGAGSGDVTEMQRTRPDGEVVRGWLALPAFLGRALPPFLTQHDLTAAEWRPADRAARAAQVHPFGGRALLARLELEVDDPVAVGRRYRNALGVTPIAAGDGRVQLAIGQQVVGLRRRSSAGLADATIVVVGSAGGLREAEVSGVRFRVEVAG
jgi:hypothetical protein